MHNVSSEQIVIIFIRIQNCTVIMLKNKFIDGVAVESFIQTQQTVKDL